MIFIFSIIVDISLSLSHTCSSFSIICHTKEGFRDSFWNISLLSLKFVKRLPMVFGKPISPNTALEIPDACQGHWQDLRVFVTYYAIGASKGWPINTLYLWLRFKNKNSRQMSGLRRRFVSHFIVSHWCFHEKKEEFLINRDPGTQRHLQER